MPAAVDSVEQLTHRGVHRMMQRLQQDVITIRRRVMISVADLWAMRSATFNSRLALMNYADARRRELPIGSGAVEATRKSLAPAFA
jgi:hypothetical protein